MFFVFLLVPSCSCMILSCLYAVFVFIAELLCLSILMFSFALRFFTFCFFFFFKQNAAYDWRISDWGSDVCSSDLFSRPRRRRDADELALLPRLAGQLRDERLLGLAIDRRRDPRRAVVVAADPGAVRDATRHLRAQPRLGVRLMAKA